MDIQAVLLAISSVIVMLATAIIAKPSMTPETKRAITVGASIVIGAVTALVNGQIVGVPPDVVAWSIKVLTSIAFVAGGSQAAYLLFKGSAEKIETKFNGDPPGVAAYVKKKVA